ncbi:MAG: four helix bundle protein [Cytophagales bacterium]
MFDFEKLDVYKKAKKFYSANLNLIRGNNLDRIIENQLSRAALSVVLNLVEGSGRFSKADRAHFYVMSRSSLFECTAVIDILRDEKMISIESYSNLYNKSEELSKILFTMIRNLKIKK